LPRLIDSHAHLEMDHFRDDIEMVISRARERGIEKIISIGIDVESSIRSLELSKRFEGVYTTIGFHPHEADRFEESILDRLKELSGDPKIVAVGEIGLDFYKRYSEISNQVRVLNQMLDLSKELRLPVILHIRDAFEEAISVLKSKGRDRIVGVVHCFSGNYNMAKRFLDMGLYISIAGTITYKGSENLHEVVKEMPLDRLLVETDSPFLSPQPMRGKRNEPSFVIYTAEKIAELREMDLEELSHRIYQNTISLFNIS